MPNHVHLILTPVTAHGLSRAVGEAHRRFTGYMNARARETGHLFQGRFGNYLHIYRIVARLKVLQVDLIRQNVAIVVPQRPETRALATRGSRTKFVNRRGQERPARTGEQRGLGDHHI